jgi:hypothetical protein
MTTKLDKGPFADIAPDLEDAITRYGTPPYRQTVTVSVRSVGNYSFDSLPTDIEAWIDWLDAAKKEVPDQYWDSHRCVLNYESGYYDSGDSASFDICYERPETDEEMTERVGRGIAYVRQGQAAERATYEALKQKFG